jgi:ribulose-phosphate 3-epimerase
VFRCSLCQLCSYLAQTYSKSFFFFHHSCSIDAGASYISFHPEATSHVDRTIQLIKDGNCRAGLALNPATPLTHLDWVLDKLDFVLLMSVNPGFGGQSFLPSTLEKARAVRKMIVDKGLDGKVRIQIDGGVKTGNIREVAGAGVEMIVAGSAIFKEPRTVEAYAGTIDELRKEIAARGKL